MTEEVESVEDVGASLVQDYLDAVVDTLKEVELNWTTGSPYFDLARQMLLQMEDQLPSDLLENNRPEVLQGMTDALEENEVFDVEEKDTEDPEDPIKYRRVILKE